MTTNPQDLDALILDLRPMNGCNEFDRAVEAIESLRAENEALRRDLLAAEERGIQIGLRAAAEKLRSQGYGTAVRQILAMIPEGE